MNETQQYYEQYWSDPSAAPPLQDPTTPARKRLLAEALQGLGGRRVLDVGCGAGIFTEHLKELGYEPVGLDVSEKALRFAQQRVPGAEFHAGLIEDHIERFRGQFHAIWCSEVIEHVFDVYGLLTSMHKCLAPGGRLVLTTPYHGLLKNLLIDLRNYPGHYNPFGGHIRFFDRTSLRRCLEHCGFEVLWWRGIGRTWPLYRSFFMVAQKAGEPAPRPPADS